MSANITTLNETQTSSCYNPGAVKIAQTVACCVVSLFSLARNTVIGIIVYRAKTMRQPINFIIVNMAMSDLLNPIFAISRVIQTPYRLMVVVVVVFLTVSRFVAVSDCRFIPCYIELEVHNINQASLTTNFLKNFSEDFNPYDLIMWKALPVSSEKQNKVSKRANKRASN